MLQARHREILSDDYDAGAGSRVITVPVLSQRLIERCIFAVTHTLYATEVWKVKGVAKL